ncbi:MAG TPA: D-arabinono-1,4-lactone oxidase [Candidatus Kapabacteria bacterium]|nr:D-arabinono-1,4-lactone oxidase [Candidatus Kapabacteria bacterium]
MATNREKLARLMEESIPHDEKESLLAGIFDDIRNDARVFFNDVTEWITREKPMFRKSEGKTRQTWENDTRNQVVQPLQYVTPKSIDDVVEIIRTAEANGLKVRAVGSGHSFSDVVQTNDVLINTDQLGSPIELDRSLLKDGVDTSCLVHVENGMKIRALNTYLDEHDLALPNMGGYDAQSIVGAASTGTHGSGISLGPIASIYRSIVVVGDGGIRYRIEPTNGITDPDKYRAKFPDNRLIQDDQWFNTVAVSMGCTGIIYSVIMEMIPKYWLREVRTMSDWDSVKKMLMDGAVLRDNRHFEVLVNPYAQHGRHDCLITERNMTSKPTEPPYERPHRNYLTALIGLIPGAVDIFDFLFNEFPHLSPVLISEAMKGLVDDGYVDISYRVLNLGTANNISAYSAEIAFPMKDNRYIHAVDHMLEVADQMRRVGDMYHCSPISLRFVKGSDAYLAMMNGEDTCMVEIPVINGTWGGFQLLERYESAMYAFSGRPHWGQVNYMTGSHDLVRSMYPNYDRWLEVYNRMNANGTFNNVFTDRCGFSPITFEQA